MLKSIAVDPMSNKIDLHIRQKQSNIQCTKLDWTERVSGIINNNKIDDTLKNGMLSDPLEIFNSN